MDQDKFVLDLEDLPDSEQGSETIVVPNTWRDSRERVEGYNYVNELQDFS